MLITIFSLIVLFAVALFIFLYTGPQLPKNIDDLVKEVKNEVLPELIPGDTGYAKNQKVSIFYNSIGNPHTAKGTILFVCGHSSTLIDWQAYIIQPFLDADYHVVRYDNRGLGMSNWMENWSKHNAYTLDDMAKDGMAVLDALHIQKAHIVGMSMGGMIGQQMAINHGDRVLSLTSIMSSGFYYDPKLSNLPLKFSIDFVRYLLKYGIRLTEENGIKFHLAVNLMLKGEGNYSIDHKEILQKALYTLRKRKGVNRKVRHQHTAAIQKSGSRYDQLPHIKVPTLVIHGTTDPLVLFDHAKKYAPMIPHAKTLFIEGMGHDMPKPFMDKMKTAMLKNFERATITQ